MTESKYNSSASVVDISLKLRRQPAGNMGTRVISFTSGKGGVGKTNTVVNVGIALARQGNRVLLLDADLGLANIDILLGLKPKFTLEDLFNGRRELADIILDGPEGMSIIPASSGAMSICNLNTEKRVQLMEAIEQVGANYDYLLIDTSAGIDSDVMYFNSASTEVVVIINSEPTSLADAYAVIKLLATEYAEKRFSIVANNVRSEAEGLKAFNSLSKTVERFLQVNLNYLGVVPTDSAVQLAVSEQRALLELYPSSSAGLALSQIARKIDDLFLSMRVKGGMQFFLGKL